jgi:hypothetical protein
LKIILILNLGKDLRNMVKFENAKVYSSRSKCKGLKVKVEMIKMNKMSQHEQNVDNYWNKYRLYHYLSLVIDINPDKTVKK